MNLSSENSHRVANLSFAVTCIVVLVHVPWPQDDVVGKFFVCAVRNTLASLVVPFFSTVAGFMLAGHFDEKGWWKRAVLKRIRTLLIPYAAWIALGASAIWLCTGVRPIGFSNCGLDFTHYPLIVPLWYLRALFLVAVASPLLRTFVDRCGWSALAVGWLLLLGQMTMIGTGRWSSEYGIGGLLTTGISLETTVYFSLGLWLRRHRLCPINRKIAAASLLIAMAILSMGLLAMRLQMRPLVNLYAVAVPFWLIAIWGVAPTSPWPRWLVSSSFAVYVMHAVVLNIVFSLSVRLPSLFTVLLGISIPIAASRLLAQIAPRSATLLFGGRVDVRRSAS